LHELSFFLTDRLNAPLDIAAQLDAKISQCRNNASSANISLQDKGVGGASGLSDRLPTGP